MFSFAYPRYPHELFMMQNFFVKPLEPWVFDNHVRTWKCIFCLADFLWFSAVSFFSFSLIDHVESRRIGWFVALLMNFNRIIIIHFTNMYHKHKNYVPDMCNKCVLTRKNILQFDWLRFFFIIIIVCHDFINTYKWDLQARKCLFPRTSCFEQMMIVQERCLSCSSL